MNYTPHQQEAIEARGENLLISAAAGSGKTRVLVDRIVHMMVEDEVPLAHMLIVTFTNAAAGEMKARLRKSLEEAARGATGENRAFLLAQLEALAEAHISTMHAFCIAELRRFYHVLGLDPNFKVLPETTTAILREDALEQVMDAAYEEAAPEFLRLVEAYGGRMNDAELRKMVRDAYGRLQSHMDPLGWFGEQAAAYEAPLGEEYEALLRTLVKEALDAAASAIRQARTLADMLPNAEKMHEMLNDDETILLGLRHVAEAEDVVDAFMDYLPRITWTKKPNKPRSATAEEADADAALKTLREAYKKRLEGLKDLTIEGGSARIQADRALVGSYLKALLAFLEAYDAAYKEAKKERQGLDFNDLEHDMLRLLQDEDTRAAIREEVQYIFFDEYQDANPIQEAIVEALQTEGQLFFVGDVKQAIYRFRRADPNIFNRRYARYRDSDAGRLIFLAENFRSRGEILDFANALFSSLMTPSLGEVDYKEPGQSLVCGAPVEANAESVQCVALAKAEDGEEDAEAAWIATEIQRLVVEGSYDYGDMVVLMRSPRSRLHQFEEVFKRRHIPYYSDNSVVGFENLEVRLFLAMLEVLANDSIDTSLLAALVSPFGGLTDNELAAIRLEQMEGTFFDACQAYMRAHEDAVEEKLARFYARVRRYRKALAYDTAAEVARRMFVESGYNAFLLGMDDGVERAQNVEAFITLLANYEAEHRYGLPGFLHYVNTLKKRSLDSAMPAIGLNEDDHTVRIMSIHKSKGLGFKVVFLADMAHSFNFSDTKPPLVVDDTLGAAMTVVDLEHGTTHTSFEKKLIAQKNRRETLSEEVRLLYVALTRAVDRLYLVAQMKPKELEKWQDDRGRLTANEETFRRGHSYRDWVWTALSDPDHALSLDADVPLYRYMCIDEMMAAETGAEKTDYSAVLSAADDAEMEAIRARFHATYPYMDATVQPFKKTVSQLAKENQVVPDYIKGWPEVFASAAEKEAEVPVPVPEFIQEHLSFTAAALGTLMHQVVQWLPLVPMTRAEIERALEQLEARAFLTKDERQAVDMEMLEAFYASDFVRRIVAEGRNFEHEVSFTMRLDDYMVDGQIDFFFETDAGYEIVDFKTDRHMNAERYKKQLALYAKALSAARGKPVTHKWIYWLRHQKAEEV